MKFIHLSDLHIGKRLKEQSLIDDQKRMLDDFITIAEENSVDAIIIAGDIYDRSIPSLEAVNAFDDFLTRLIELKIKVYIIAGNHDSAERSRIPFRNYVGSAMKKSASTMAGLNVSHLPGTAVRMTPWFSHRTVQEKNRTRLENQESERLGWRHPQGHPTKRPSVFREVVATHREWRWK